MADKWVENNGYVGPDRRKRPGPKRWSERRRHDETGAAPPVAALLRRLRVQLIGMYTPEDRRRVQQLLLAAIHQAQRQRMFDCADALKRAEHLLRTGPAGDLSKADAALLEAMTLASANR